MVYVNKPKPSKGLVSLCILGILVYVVGILIITIIFNILTSNPILGPFSFDQFDVLTIIPIPPPIILFGIFIHTLYNTEYRIEDGKLWMKYEYLKKRSVPLDEIRGIEIDISGNWRLAFHIVYDSYCNRFKNRVGIITEDGTIWVSPEDSEEFISKLGLKTSN